MIYARPGLAVALALAAAACTPAGFYNDYGGEASRSAAPFSPGAADMAAGPDAVAPDGNGLGYGADDPDLAPAEAPYPSGPDMAIGPYPDNGGWIGNHEHNEWHGDPARPHIVPGGPSPPRATLFRPPPVAPIAPAPRPLAARAPQPPPPATAPHVAAAPPRAPERPSL